MNIKIILTNRPKYVRIKWNVIIYALIKIYYTRSFETNQLIFLKGENKKWKKRLLRPMQMKKVLPINL